MHWLLALAAFVTALPATACTTFCVRGPDGLSREAVRAEAARVESRRCAMAT